MTEDEISKIKEHIEIYARKESRAIKITEIMRRVVKELESLKDGMWFVYETDDRTWTFPSPFLNIIRGIIIAVAIFIVWKIWG